MAAKIILGVIIIMAIIGVFIVINPKEWKELNSDDENF